MENLAYYPTIVLEVQKIEQSDKTSKKLRKKLLQMNGVYSINVEPKKKLVTVIGNIDPIILIKDIEKLIGSAELLYYEKNRKVFDNHGDKDEFKSSKNVKAKCSKDDHNEKKNVRENEREKSQGSCKAEKSKKKKDDGHVIEAYEAPKIDPAVCRDPYCKLHKCRPIIHSKDNAGHPHHTDGYSFPRGIGSQSSIFYGPFPYDHPMMEPPMLPPSSFGFHPGTPCMPGFDYFGSHGDYANFSDWYM